MLPKPVTDLLVEIFAHQGEEITQEVREDPKAYLLSLLSTIKEEVPDKGWLILGGTLDRAAGHVHSAKEDEREEREEKGTKTKPRKSSSKAV